MDDITTCWERGGQPEWDNNDYQRDFIYWGIRRDLMCDKNVNEVSTGYATQGAASESYAKDAIYKPGLGKRVEREKRETRNQLERFQKLEELSMLLERNKEVEQILTLMSELGLR